MVRMPYDLPHEEFPPTPEETLEATEHPLAPSAEVGTDSWAPGTAILDVAIQTARGLHVAHELGLVH